jgi:hypothetical protein
MEDLLHPEYAGNRRKAEREAMFGDRPSEITLRAGGSAERRSIG